MAVPTILIRASSLDKVCSQPREKSPKQKLEEAKANLDLWTSQYAAMNPSTKTADKKLAQINKIKAEIPILTEQAKAPFISKTAQKAIMSCYRSQVLGRYDDNENKYTKKGRLGEEEGITFVSRALGKLLFKNGERRENEWLTGEWDIAIENAEGRIVELIDIKCSFNASSFMDALSEETNSDYYGQGQAYMELTGAKKYRIAYVLLNTPDSQIRGFIYTESYKYPNGEVPLKDKLLLIRNHIYDRENFERFCTENSYLPHSLEKEFETEKEAQDNKEALAVYLDFKEVEMSKRVHFKEFEYDPEYIENAKGCCEEANKWFALQTHLHIHEEEK